MPVSLGKSALRIFGAAVFLTFALIFPAPSDAQNEAALAPGPASPIFAPTSRAETHPDTTIVIGFLGGHVDHANSVHAEVQLVQKLREQIGSSIDAETYENRRYMDAYNHILALLDTDRDGTLSADEKRHARIILYGHSWGAAAVLALARQLQSNDIPVRLTIQVDSVPHFGQDDSIVPSNVAKAANFYQLRGSVHGQPAITAADAAHTQILGNFRFDYSHSPVVCEGYPWWNHYFMKSHTAIECDPKVWSQVEALIRAELPFSPSSPSVASNASPATSKP
jgi:hypothetical protein